jgi:predicted DNA-binding transcriptional regulator AlpA
MKTLAEKLADLHSKIDDLCARAVEVDRLMREIEEFDTGAELLSERQVSSAFNISKKTLQNWRGMKPPRGPAYQKAGRKVLYKRSDVQQWLQH